MPLLASSPAAAVARVLRQGLLADAYTPTKATYDLRRLRLKGIIERVPHSHRYRVKAHGLCLCLAVVKLHDRVLAPAYSHYRVQPTSAQVERAAKAVEHHLAGLAAIA